jgi:CRP/FNR family cyclic AMP-dependent transcriptional regulator
VTEQNAAAQGWFAELPEPLRAAFETVGKRLHLDGGALLHARGDLADGVYRVVSGGVRVSSLTTDGRELVLTHLLPGDVFGEISMFDGQPRTHDATATEPSELSVLDAAHFQRLLGSHPELGAFFLRMLCLKLRAAFEALDGAALETVAVRLARRLWWMTGPGPARAGAAEPLRALVLSQGELASMIGCTRQSVNRELQALVRRGVVELHGKRITVLDRAALLGVGGGDQLT